MNKIRHIFASDVFFHFVHSRFHMEKNNVQSTFIEMVFNTIFEWQINSKNISFTFSLYFWFLCWNWNASYWQFQNNFSSFHSLLIKHSNSKMLEDKVEHLRITECWSEQSHGQQTKNNTKLVNRRRKFMEFIWQFVVFYVEKNYFITFLSNRNDENSIEFWLKIWEKTISSTIFLFAVSKVTDASQFIASVKRERVINR